jgi:hypothetical protein
MKRLGAPARVGRGPDGRVGRPAAVHPHNAPSRPGTRQGPSIFSEGQWVDPAWGNSRPASPTQSQARARGRDRAPWATGGPGAISAVGAVGARRDHAGPAGEPWEPVRLTPAGSFSSRPRRRGHVDVAADRHPAIEGGPPSFFMRGAGEGRRGLGPPDYQMTTDEAKIRARRSCGVLRRFATNCRDLRLPRRIADFRRYSRGLVSTRDCDMVRAHRALRSTDRNARPAWGARGHRSKSGRPD